MSGISWGIKYQVTYTWLCSCFQPQAQGSKKSIKVWYWFKVLSMRCIRHCDGGTISVDSVQLGSLFWWCWPYLKLDLHFVCVLKGEDVCLTSGHTITSRHEACFNVLVIIIMVLEFVSYSYTLQSNSLPWSLFLCDDNYDTLVCVSYPTLQAFAMPLAVWDPLH